MQKYKHVISFFDRLHKVQSLLEENKDRLKEIRYAAYFKEAGKN